MAVSRRSTQYVPVSGTYSGVRRRTREYVPVLAALDRPIPRGGLAGRGDARPGRGSGSRDGGGASRPASVVIALASRHAGAELRTHAQPMMRKPPVILSRLDRHQLLHGSQEVMAMEARWDQEHGNTRGARVPSRHDTPPCTSRDGSAGTARAGPRPVARDPWPATRGRDPWPSPCSTAAFPRGQAPRKHARGPHHARRDTVVSSTPGPEETCPRTTPRETRHSCFLGAWPRGSTYASYSRSMNRIGWMPAVSGNASQTPSGTPSARMTVRHATLPGTRPLSSVMPAPGTPVRMSGMWYA